MLSSQIHAEPILEVTDLSQAYGAKRVLKNVSLCLGAGEVSVLLGANGSGKTTLLKVIAGLLRPLAGRILTSLPLSARSLFTPAGHLYEDLSVGENLQFFSRLFGATAPHLDEVVSLLHLESLWEIQVRRLSFGQKMRTGLARTLLQSASLYLLDEPLTGLDEESRQSLLGALRDLKKRGGSLLMTTHQPEGLKELADSWYELKQGELKSLPFPLVGAASLPRIDPKGLIPLS